MTQNDEIEQLRRHNRRLAELLRFALGYVNLASAEQLLEACVMSPSKASMTIQHALADDTVEISDELRAYLDQITAQASAPTLAIRAAQERMRDRAAAVAAERTALWSHGDLVVQAIMELRVEEVNWRPLAGAERTVGTAEEHR